MSISNQAMTSTANPPLAYTKEAIRGHLQHHATNGPAYVQIQATKALARMIGLYDEAKDAARKTKDAALEKTKDAVHPITKKLNTLMQQAGITELSDFSCYSRKKRDEPADEDEEEANSDDAEPL